MVRKDPIGADDVAIVRNLLDEVRPDLVCALHRGLVEGVVEGVGGGRVSRFGSLIDRVPCQVDVDFGETEMDPELTMSMKADTAHRFWLASRRDLSRRELAVAPVKRPKKLEPNRCRFRHSVFDVSVEQPLEEHRTQKENRLMAVVLVSGRSGATAAAGTRKHSLSVALWIIQGVLAVLFLFTGIMKLTAPAEMLAAQVPLPACDTLQNQPCRPRIAAVPPADTAPAALSLTNPPCSRGGSVAVALASRGLARLRLGSILREE